MSAAQLTSRDVLIQAEDIEAAAAFYTEAMGLTESMREPGHHRAGGGSLSALRGAWTGVRTRIRVLR